MESVIRLLLHQWQRKLFALVTAFIIWFFVSHSIIATKTIPSVPIRVINLPTDKTIFGLLPNGFLSKRMTLTISGTKDVIEQLEPGDIEIILDLSTQPNEGMVQITKKNLASLNPNFNLPKHITSLSHSELAIKMSPILTEKISITVRPPIGEAPKGYTYLDIWPITLVQTVTGPQDEVLKLKDKGLELTINLKDISREQLDMIQENGIYNDEIVFFIPESWKRVNIPFHTKGTEAINDLNSKKLQVTFLREHFLPLKTELPLHVFYPLKHSDSINPNTYILEPSAFIQIKNQIPVLTLPLLADQVSQLFLEIVKENIELDIVTAPLMERETLEWGVTFIDASHLEDTYVAFLLSKNLIDIDVEGKHFTQESLLRERFRSYIQRFSLYLNPQNKLELDSRLEDGKIRVHIPNSSLIIKSKPLHAS